MKKKDYLDNLKEHRVLREQKIKAPCIKEEQEELEEFGLDTIDFADRKAKTHAYRSGLHQAAGAAAGAASRAAAFALQQKKWEEERQAAKARGERT